MTIQGSIDYQPPVIIALSGVDGSGKSTQISLLQERLRAEGVTATSIWVGGTPYITRPAVAVAKRFLRSPLTQPSQRTSMAHRSTIATSHVQYLRRANSLFKRSRLLRWGWVQVSLLEHALEARVKVRRSQRRRQVIICDRYLLTSIVDAVVLTNLSQRQSFKLLNHPAFRLAPRLDWYGLIDVPAEVALKRIHDAPSPEFIRRRVPTYRALAKHTGMPIVDGTLPAQEVADQIWLQLTPLLTARDLLPETSSRIPTPATGYIAGR